MADSVDLAGPPVPGHERLNKILAGLIAVEAVVHIALRVQAGNAASGVAHTVGLLALMAGTVWTLFTPSKTREGSTLRRVLGVYTLIAFSLIVASAHGA